MKNLYVGFLLGCLLCFGGNVLGQFNINAGSTNYTQDFNSLTGTTWTNNTTPLTGWYARTTATASITGYAANTGTTTTAGLYSFAITGTNPLSDKALGYAPSNAYTGAAGSGAGYMAWRLKNNTGSTITAITITYSGEQWRKDNTLNQSITVEYQTGATVTDPVAGTWTGISGLTFTSPVITAGTAALDGNASANRVANISATITVTIPAGEEIMIRWTDLNDSGNDHFLAIDDVVVNATVGASTYAVTYDGNGNTSGSVPTDGNSYSSGATVTVLGNTGSLAQTCGTFNGWNTAANGSGSAYAPAATFTITANTTLYAQWTSTSKTVIFNGNGSTGGSMANQSACASTALTTNAFTRTGYTFAGWNTAADGSGTAYANGASYPFTADITLYAQWNVDLTPSITTSGTLSSVNTTYGTASANTSFSVSAANLSGNLVITPPVGFEISTSAIFSTSFNNASPLSIAPSGGTVPSTTIYVRLAATTAVGTYSGNITLVSGATNSSIATASSVVSAKALTITGLSATDKIYDRTTTVSVTGTPAYSGLVNGESFTVSGSVSWAFPDANVGANKVLTRTGSYTAPSGNYTVTQPSLTASITAKALTVTGATAQNKVYDGTTTATITGATLVGVISPDVVTVSGGGTFASANVGTGIGVTANLVLGGANAGNYTLTQPTGLSANITQATPTITATTINITVGGTYLLPGANISSNSGGTISYVLGTPSPAGSVTLTGGNTLNGIAVGTAVLTINQAASGNYAAGSTTVTVNVTMITYVDGDFMTNTGGTWNINGTGTATWLKRISGSFQSTSEIPNGTAGSYTVYITQDVTVPNTGSSGTFATAKLYVTNNAKFTYSWTSSQFTFRNVIIDNGATIEMDGRFTILSSGDFEIKDGGNFIFSYTTSAGSSSFLTSTLWNGTEKFSPNSNFIVKNHQTGGTNYFLPSSGNLSTTSYNGVNAYFGNLKIESPTEVRMTDVNLSSTTTYLTHNNLEFTTTAGYSLLYGNGTWIIGKDLVMNSGSGNLTITTGANTINLNVKGDFKGTASNTFRLVNNAAGNVTMNVDGNVVLNSGTLDLNFTSGGTGTVNLKGDLTVLASGTLLANTNTTTNFNFSGTGDGLTDASTQTIDVASTGATRNQNINFYALTGSYVQLKNQDLQLGTNSTFTVNGTGGSTGAVLDFYFNSSNTALNISTVSGATGTRFKLGQTNLNTASGATLKISSPLGISASSGTSGNVQVTNAPDYNQYSTFWYMGRAHQSTGTGIVSGTSYPKQVICDLLSNSLQLTLSGTFGVDNSNLISSTGGKLDIRKGQVIETETAYISNSSGTLYMAPGTLYKVMKGEADATTAYGNLIPRMNGGLYAYSLTGGTIELGGTIANNYFQVLRSQSGGADISYHNLTFSGTNTLGTDFKGISSKIVVTDSLYITGNAIVDCRTSSGAAASFEGAGGLVMDGGRIRFKNVSVAQPELTGTNVAYKLDAGVTEFYGSSASNRQTIKGKNQSGGYDIIYKEIEITGDLNSPDSSNVGQSGQDIYLNATGGKLTVKAAASGINKAGVFTMSNFSVRSNASTNTSSVTVQNGALFVTNSSKGFSGFTTSFSDNSSVHANVNTVSLEDGSTVLYNRTGDQDISNQVPYYHLSLYGTGTKTAPLGGTVTVKGNLVKSGSSAFAHNEGTFAFTGTALQSYTVNSPSATLEFNNVSNTNAAGLNLVSDMGISQKLSFGASAKLNLVDTADVIIRSKADTTGYVGAIPAANTISYTGTGLGRFVVERYVSYTRKWQLLSIPTQTTETIRDSWQDGGSSTSSPTGYGVQITAPGGGSGLDGSSVTASMKYYNTATDDFTGIMNTLSGIQRNSGYFLYVYGNRSAGAGTAAGPVTTLRTRGKLFNANGGSEQPTAINTSVTAGQWISVGNPFASKMHVANWMARNTGSAGFVNSYVIWDPSWSGTAPNDYGAGAYQTITATTGYLATPGGSTLYSTGPAYTSVQSGAAFYIEAASGGTVNIPFAEADKTDGSQTVNRGPVTADEVDPAAVPMLSTFITDMQGNIGDGNRVVFDNQYRDELDHNDAGKRTNEGISFGMDRGDKWLAVEARSAAKAGDTIHYSMGNIWGTSYRLVFAVQNIYNPSLQAELVDRFTQRRHPVSLNDSSFIDITMNDDPASRAYDRFYLLFKQARPATSLPLAYISVNAQRQAGGQVEVSWKVANEQNIRSYTVQRGSGPAVLLDMAELTATNSAQYTKNDERPLTTDNYYRIKATDASGAFIYSDVVKVEGTASMFSIRLLSNPVTGNKIPLEIRNAAVASNYQASLYSEMGQLIHRQQVRVQAGSQLLQLNMGNIPSAGNYKLVIRDNTGLEHVLPVLIAK